MSRIVSGNILKILHFILIRITVQVCYKAILHDNAHFPYIRHPTRPSSSMDSICIYETKHRKKTIFNTYTENLARAQVSIANIKQMLNYSQHLPFSFSFVLYMYIMARINITTLRCIYNIYMMPKRKSHIVCEYKLNIYIIYVDLMTWVFAFDDGL